MSQANTERILIVAKDVELRGQLVDTLGYAGGYIVNETSTFQEALSQILLTDFDLIITEAVLPDLSGKDLLTVVGGLRPGARVIVIDDDLSARSAVAVFRLGAVDYLYKPLNMSFLLMQVERQLEQKRLHKQQKALEKNSEQTAQDDDASSIQPSDPVFVDEQLSRIEVELNHLLGLVQAGFVGLVDAQGNLISGVGTFDERDLGILTRALSNGNQSHQSSSNPSQGKKFYSTHFQGEQSSVYIIGFSSTIHVSLVLICSPDVNAGMVWAYSKRTAAIISEILHSVPGT